MLARTYMMSTLQKFSKSILILFYPFTKSRIYDSRLFVTHKKLKMTFRFRLVFSALLVFNKVLSVTACTESQYRKTSVTTGVAVCVDCPKCPHGYGLLVECGSNLTATARIACKPCTEGVDFSSSYNNYEQCLPCSVCSKDQVMTPCTPHSNIVCHKKCISKQNYYEKTSEDCQPCSWCCGDGDDIVQEECTKKGMPKHQSCTVHRRKKCTPAPTTPTTTKPPTDTLKPSTTPLSSSIMKFLKSTDSTLNPTTSDLQNKKQDPGQENKPDVGKIILIILSTCFAVTILLIAAYIWNRRRKRHSSFQNCTGVRCTLIHVEEDGGTGKKLFDIFEENSDLKQKVCTKLDCQESFLKVAVYYKMDQDVVKKLQDSYRHGNNNPTQDVFEFVQTSCNPNLLVTEFIACTNEIGRKDVTELLIPFR